MAQRTLPNLGLDAFFILGKDGWKDAMDLNLLKLSVLVQGGVIDKVAALPGSPTAGDVYLLDEAHGTNPNEVAVYDDATWKFIAPVEGWLLYNRAADYYEKFDGAVWSELATGGGGGTASLPAVTEKTGTAINLLAADSGKYLRFTDAAAKTLTVRPEATEALPADGEWNIRNVGAGDLTIAAGSGVTIAAPAGGSLVVPERGTVTLKRVAADSFDLLGATVAA